MEELSKRKEQILAVLTEAYIQTGEPVGSKGIMEKLGGTVSSATIRNEMAELHEMGYLMQPHTSAGRIPTAKALRLYIDHLMQPSTLPEETCREIDAELEKASDPETLMETASSILSRETGCATITTAPQEQTAIIRKMEMIPISSHAVALLMMTGTGAVHTRVCRLLIPIQEETFAKLSEVLAGYFSRRPLSEIGLPQVQSLLVKMGSDALACAPIVTAAYEMVKESVDTDVRFKGQLNLLRNPDYEPERIHNLLGFLSEQGRLSQLLQSHTGGLRVVFGDESRTPELDGTSLIVTHYTPHGGNGTIGLIGPQRMRYDVAIPTLEYMALAVSRVFDQFMEE